MCFTALMGKGVTMKRLVALVLVAGALAACGGSDVNLSDGGDSTTRDTSAAENLPTTTEADLGIPMCSEWLERAVTAEEVGDGCQAPGNSIEGTATYPCDDGTVLYWNDSVWGYVGEKAHAYTAADEQPGVAPSAEREACPA